MRDRGEVTQVAEPYKVTALVSTYRSERFIAGCLDDLERQTVADQLEIIVVNSNSDQNEAEIVRDRMLRYSNIVYIETAETETVYGAWNRGIAVARGEYLTNANTDDRHRRDAFEIMSRTLDRHPDVGLVYAGYRITEREGETFEENSARESFMPRPYNPRRLRKGYCFPGPQPMWRRSVHAEFGLFDDAYSSAGDLEFWLRIAPKYPFMLIPEYLGLYLRSPESIEHRDKRVSRREAAEIVRKYRRRRYWRRRG